MLPTRILGTLCIGVCAIVLCGGLVAGNLGVAQMAVGTGCLVVLARLFDRITRRWTEEGDGSQQAQARVEERFAEIERRLTDIQEVQIALSERTDQMQQGRAAGPQGAGS